VIHETDDRGGETEMRERIRDVRDRMAQAALRSRRPPGAVCLVAVTKTVPAGPIRAVLPWVDALGENRIQEAEGKISELGASLPWRMIGRLQRNKARKALSLFSTVDSVDSLPLAAALDRILQEEDRQGFPILLEVNVSEERAKGGIPPEGLEALAGAIREECPRLFPKGLMTVAPLLGGESAARRAFATLRELRDRLAPGLGLPLPELSMGMSGDFEAAIEEGSTMIRIGSALFGPRG
jgi:pyridoxal phosphate enzyme (YggS family)